MSKRRILGKVIHGKICLVVYMQDRKAWCAFTIEGKKLVATWK